MAQYLGYIQKKLNKDFYYFNPTAELKQVGNSGIYNVTVLELEDLQGLFSKSIKWRILLAYHTANNAHKNYMETHFEDGSLAVCEVNRNDFDKDLSQKYGCYALAVADLIRNKRISFIHNKNIFHVVSNSRWLNDFLNRDIDKIYLNEFDSVPQTILCSERILLRCKNDFLAGPCEVKRESSTGLLYVTPPSNSSKYILSGYNKNNLAQFVMYSGTETFSCGEVWVLRNKEHILKDFITVEELMEDFKFTFVDKDINLDRAAIHNLIDRYAKSVFWGIPADVQSSRLRRLEEALLESKYLADKFNDIVKDVDVDELVKTQMQLEREIDSYTKQNEELRRQNEKLRSANENLKAGFDELINSAQKDIVKIAFDGFLANKLIDAATNFGVDDESAQYKNIVAKVASIPAQNKNPAELIKYLCGMVNVVRPAYDRNTIINIAICLTQGFLTVFYGEPGCGKTSICNIIADVLGLNKISKIVDDDRAKRYVPVSVEKGWTSKRDFTGYYNPLSKTFDKNNRRVYDILRLLDIERRDSKFPCVILLDEANLSPMEHYWSDFMNICDGVDENSHVNLGADSVFAIPETLRFVATINNDHTTENLSPRLIDRAWLVSLPDNDINFASGKLPADKIELITWKSLSDAFTPNADDYKNFPAQIYKSIIDKFGEQNFSISPRIHNAVKNYCAVASKYFSGGSALDYAVAQRILPKIVGNGEEFQHWLGSLGKLFAENDMIHSAKIVRNIIERGNNQLDYYGFFL